MASDGKKVAVNFAALDNASADIRLLIQSVANRGGMQLDKKGTFFEDDCTEEFKQRMPEYDYPRLSEAFPGVFEIEIIEDTDEDTGEVVHRHLVLKTGRADHEVPLNDGLPKDTDALIETVKQFMQSMADKVTETHKVFEGFDDD